MNNISDFSNLNYFIKNSKVPNIEITGRDFIDFSLGFFIGIENGYLLSEANQLPAQSLRQTWKEVHTCLTNVITYLKENWNYEVGITKDYIELYMDNEIFYDLKREFERFPVICCPIYLITVGEKEDERIVYIGKTSSKKNRFKGGHSAALKLHHPKFNGLKKNIYFASVMLLSKDNDYVPLEFISTLKGAEKLLLEIEASLIYYFKPELNTLNTTSANYNINSQIHIQNFSKYSDFLNDQFIGV